MSKVVLHGDHSINNFGDVLLYEIYKNWVEELGVIPHVYDGIFSNNQNYIKGKRTSINKSDYVIFHGGGYPNNKKEGIYNSIKKDWQLYKSYYKVAKMVSGYSILGVGVGPYKRTFSKKLAKNFFSGAEYISVRDLESVEWLKKIGVAPNKVHLIPDSSLCLKPETIKENYNKDVLLHITVNEVPFLRAVKKFINENDHLEFTIVNDQDTKTKIKKLDWYFSELSGLNNITKVIYNNPTQLLREIKSHDCTVTTKYHVGILASLFNKKVISLSWDYQKVSRFYNQIGRSDICLKPAYDDEEYLFAGLNKIKNSQNVQIPEEVISESFKNREIIKSNIMSA